MTRARASLLVAPRIPLAVDLYGYGQVARGLLPLLSHHGIPVASIRDRSGLRAFQPVPGARHVLVDATSPRYHGPAAEAWVRTLEQSLASGTPLVTCNKAPLALAWDRLAKAADRGGVPLACSATVGGGTPVLHFLRRIQSAHGLLRLEAVLSGTLSFVLHQVARGRSLDEAIREAQRAGFAEPDPTLDLNGTDALAKAVILHNRLFPDQAALRVRPRSSRFSIDETLVRSHVRKGRTPQAIATVSPNHVSLALSGREGIDALPESPGFVTVRAWTPTGAVFHLTGPGAGPAVTAGSLLADLLALREHPWQGSGGILP